MSLFKKIFSADPEALAKKADALFAAGDFGPAKLAYDKAAAASPPEGREPLEAKARACTDAIARQRIDEAKRYLADGALDLAEQELSGAVEVAADDALRREAQGLLDGLEADDAQAQATTEQMTDEERLAVLMGQWGEARAEEYETYGDRFLDALLNMQRERFEEAREVLEAIRETAPSPRYLWLEVGRARLLTEDARAAEDALQRFLDSLADGEDPEAALAVNLTLAGLADEDGRFEEAMPRFEAAVQALPEDYRPYLAMGAFLRAKGHGQEALEVLQTSLELSKTDVTDWRLLEELGLASNEAGKPEEARSFLEQVVEFFTSRQVMDFPPTTATTLAKLYETDGRLDRAADLYRALSQGSDRERHGEYHYEAGRLLMSLELGDEAHRMLTRAQALAEPGSELAEKVTAILQP